jgi:hypothetical protein
MSVGARRPDGNAHAALPKDTRPLRLADEPRRNQVWRDRLGRETQQYLAAGLLDELELHVVPVVLGDGTRLFNNLGDAEVQLEQVRAVEAPGVTHLKYRVVT